MSTILVLEDEESVNRGISFTLEKEGGRVLSAHTIKAASALLETEQPEIIICDINLPDGSGLDFISYARSRTQAYIICLTALDQEMDQVMGYSAGADDYITKPFSLAVLSLKIHAYRERKSGRKKSRLHSGDITVSLEEQKVQVRGREVSMTKNEWKLLLLFLEHPRQILSKSQILEQLFDLDGNFVDDNTVAVNITRLREKIEEDKAHPLYIKNIRGLGYIWNRECEKP